METRLVIGGTPLGMPDAKLIDVIAKARDWNAKLKSGDYRSLIDIATNANIDKADASPAFLAPSIIRDILKGHQPVDLTADILRRRSSNLPLFWKSQAVRITGLNVLAFQHEEENEKRRSLHRFTKPRNCFQPTVKFTISSLTDVTSFQEIHFGNFSPRHKTNGTWLRHKLALKNPVSQT